MKGPKRSSVEASQRSVGEMSVESFASPFRVVPTAAEGFTAMSSHLRQAHSSLSIRLTPASDLTVCRRYLNGS